jgi:serine/threonine-protein kinase
LTQEKFERFGNYILLERLASGGMAEIYLSKKLAAEGVQKFVAVKRILSQHNTSEDFIRMFKDEAKIAVNLSHSNVVSIYDFGVENQQLIL